MWLKATDEHSKDVIMFDSAKIANMNHTQGTVELDNGFTFEIGTEAVDALWAELRGNPQS